MASISDILTATKNIVTAINQLGQTYLQVVGSNMDTEITSATLVKQGQGRLARISVTVAGSAAGAVYDAPSASATTNMICVIPNTLGVTEINMPVNNGIVVAPGTGQTVSISYS
jgi:hypothetical protein